MQAETLETEKQIAIAEAAFQVFAERGFRKTSMQLIADRAGMSRPALYLHFQNKEAVFSYLSVRFFTQVAQSIAEILEHSRDPVEILNDVFDAFDPKGIMAVLLDAEHGQELMDAKSSAAHDEVDAIESKIIQQMSDWLAREAHSGRIKCDDPKTAAQTIFYSYYGLKTPPPSYAIYKRRTAQLAQLIGSGLRV